LGCTYHSFHLGQLRFAERWYLVSSEQFLDPPGRSLDDSFAPGRFPLAQPSRPANRVCSASPLRMYCAVCFCPKKLRGPSITLAMTSTARLSGLVSNPRTRRLTLPRISSSITICAIELTTPPHTSPTPESSSAPASAGMRR